MKQLNLSQWLFIIIASLISFGFLLYGLMSGVTVILGFISGMLFTKILDVLNE